MTAMAAGAYVAYRNRSHPPGVAPAGLTDGNRLEAAEEDERSAEAMPTGTADKVVAAMDATHAVPVPRRLGSDASTREKRPENGNGSAVAVTQLDDDSSDGATPSAAAAGGITNPPVALPRQRRPSGPTLIGLATAAGVGALALGAWAFVAGLGSNDTASNPAPRETVPAAPAPAPEAYEDAVALLANPAAERIPLRGSVRRIVLVVEPGGNAALVLNGLGPAPEGRAYQAWVTRRNGKSFRSAALFSGREVAVPLARPVPRGATVAVTLERARGAATPTRTPKLYVTRPA
jgi:hypothetical protein